MDANKLVVNVPAEMQAEVAGWTDGESYPVTIKQVGAGMFELESTGDTAEEADEVPEEIAEGPNISKNPAINAAAAAMEK